MEELGLRAGCTKSYVWQLERSESCDKVGAELLNRMAKALEVSLGLLMGASSEIDKIELEDRIFFERYKALSEDEKRRFRAMCALLDQARSRAGAQDPQGEDVRRPKPGR